MTYRTCGCGENKMMKKKVMKEKETEKKGGSLVAKSAKVVKKKVKATKGGNPWLKHLAKFRKEHPDIKGSEVMRMARETY